MSHYLNNPTVLNQIASEVAPAASHLKATAFRLASWADNTLPKGAFAANDRLATVSAAMKAMALQIEELAEDLAAEAQASDQPIAA